MSRTRFPEITPGLLPDEDLAASGFIPDDLSRRCFFCYTPLIPTAEIKYSGGYRRWNCPKCQARWFWTNNPYTKGLEINAALIERRSTCFGGRTNYPELLPTCADPKAPILAYQDHKEKPTHRWHSKRNCWIKLR